MRDDGWSITLDRWPLDDSEVTPLVLYLAPKGRLSPAPPRAGGHPDVYLYPGGTQSRAGEDVNTIGGDPEDRPRLQARHAFSLPALLGTSLTYVSDPLAADTVVLGTIRATFCRSRARRPIPTSRSRSPTSGRTATSSTCRRDGCARAIGSSCARRRQLSPSIYRPVHTHQLADLRPLVPGEADADRRRDPSGRPGVPRRAIGSASTSRCRRSCRSSGASLPLPIPAMNFVYHDAAAAELDPAADACRSQRAAAAGDRRVRRPHPPALQAAVFCREDRDSRAGSFCV